MAKQKAKTKEVVKPVLPETPPTVEKEASGLSTSPVEDQITDVEFEEEPVKEKVAGKKELPYLVFPSEEKTIFVEDDPTYGGAHNYSAKLSLGFKDGKAIYTENEITIRFVEKKDDGTVIDGLQSEQLAYILLDRAVKLNSRFPSRQNESMIAGLNIFLEACKDRVEERMNRGVMGELKK